VDTCISIYTTTLKAACISQQAVRNCGLSGTHDDANEDLTLLGVRRNVNCYTITTVSEELVASISNWTNLKMEAVSSSEKVVPTHPFTMHHIPYNQIRTMWHFWFLCWIMTLTCQYLDSMVPTFRRNLLFPSICSLNMRTVEPSIIVVNYIPATQRHIPEDSNLLREKRRELSSE
jgi:hypothetical protein